MTSFSPPVEIAAALACLAFLVFLFNQLARAWFILRGKPTPEEQAERASSISERVARLAQGLDDQGRRLAALEKEQRDQRILIMEENGKVYNRVKEVAEDTNVMRGELKGIKDNLALLLQRSIK